MNGHFSTNNLRKLNNHYQSEGGTLHPWIITRTDETIDPVSTWYDIYNGSVLGSKVKFKISTIRWKVTNAENISSFSVPFHILLQDGKNSYWVYTNGLTSAIPVDGGELPLYLDNIGTLEQVATVQLTRNGLCEYTLTSAYNKVFTYIQISTTLKVTGNIYTSYLSYNKILTNESEV